MIARVGKVCPRAAAGSRARCLGPSTLKWLAVGPRELRGGGKDPNYKWVCPKMDSQLASVLTRGSLDVQNGSRCAEGSGPVTEGSLDPKEEPSPCTVPGSPEPCHDKEALTIRRSAPSINGNKPEVGGTSKPASQETRKIGVFRQPITVKTGVPVLRSRPIRLKIVVPPRCKRPITNSAISPTKDFAHSHLRRPVSVSAGAETNCEIIISAVKSEGEIQDVTYHTTEEAKPEPFHEETTCKEKRVAAVKILRTDGSETTLMSSTVQILSQKGVKEETTERHIEENIPLILNDMDFKSCLTFDEMGIEEQTEPLDLSLPQKSREKRCERLLEDSGCESSLIMEVDEYEGEGDRDVVEEDDESEGEAAVLRKDATHTREESLGSPTSSTSLSSIDCDTSDLLLIDDEGIPYTLDPDGLKVPQVDVSASEDPGEGTGSPDSPPLSTLAAPSLSQSLDNALNAPCDHLYSSPAPAADCPSGRVDRTKPSAVLTSFITDSEPSDAAEPTGETVLEANAEISIPTQPIQILTNPSTSTPLLLLSSPPSSSSPSSSPQLSSAQVGLSLPLSVTQSASNPMFLLLSSIPSFSGDSASTSTPIAVLDPSTGQLSQITAASAPVSLPLPPGQVGEPASPLPTLCHPVIRLSPPNAPDFLSGATDVTSVLASLAVCSSSPARQHDRRSTSLHSQVSPPDFKPGSEAIAAEEVSSENNKPSTFAASSPHPPSASLTFDPLAQPCAEAQSPASEPSFEPSELHSEHLPLDDHLYFSSAAAPPSPPIGPVLPSDHLDPLDPLSPEGSPDAMASRRVMYCQLCPRVFFYLSDLERHAITHSQKKPHVCQQCGKAFKRSSHLQRHKHIHTGQRNFVCPICTKRFREAGELQRHQRVHTGEKPYQCQLCHTRFAERNTLRRHTKRKHPYHQVAMEMLNERRDRGGGGGGDGGVGSGVQDEEESAEWYSSTVSNLDNSESEMES
ncbi:Zinc finger protein 524 [Liparis tanakae]|uniref:Zinc finger protein 524 n=1 Tax=Liparis tanakae TaxID=230148 RepID=A0A4Z2ITB0_9TELE|nr:Zinc finger protein 524 [Liparis tanakae]